MLPPSPRRREDEVCSSRRPKGKNSRSLKVLKAPGRVAAWSPSRRWCLNRILPLFLAGHTKSLRDPVSRVRFLPDGLSFDPASPLLPRGGRRWVSRGGPSPGRDDVLSQEQPGFRLGQRGAGHVPPHPRSLFLSSFPPRSHPFPILPFPPHWVRPHFAGPQGSPGVALMGDKWDRL